MILDFLKFVAIVAIYICCVFISRLYFMDTNRPFSKKTVMIGTILGPVTVVIGVAVGVKRWIVVAIRELSQALQYYSKKG